MEDSKPRFAQWITLGIVLAAACVGMGERASAQAASPGGDANRTPVFTEQDGLRVLDRMRQALEGNSRAKFLKLFDAARMPGFAAFRDQTSQFFLQYESMRVQYRQQQVAQDGPLGALLCDFTLEAEHITNGLPPLRRSAQMRLILSWDGKDWKIADLSPRNVFR